METLRNKLRRDRTQDGAIIVLLATDRQYRMMAQLLLYPAMDPPSLSLQKALRAFAPVSAGYAHLPYAEAFNWSQLSLPLADEREWYCVAFRSKRRPGSDNQALYKADRKAHEEAIHGGGVSGPSVSKALFNTRDYNKLLLYWYGVPDAVTGMNLATCIWESRRHAVATNTRPQHKRAMELVAKSYEHYSLERYKLVKLRGKSGLSIMPYQGGEVGW